MSYLSLLLPRCHQAGHELGVGAERKNSNFPRTHTSTGCNLGPELRELSGMHRLKHTRWMHAPKLYARMMPGRQSVG